jgi:hypothetical protein
MTSFIGRFTGYRPVDGVLVPYRAVAGWIVEGTSQEYVRFDVERLEFDVHRRLDQARPVEIYPATCSRSMISIMWDASEAWTA